MIQMLIAHPEHLSGGCKAMKAWSHWRKNALRLTLGSLLIWLQTARLANASAYAQIIWKVSSKTTKFRSLCEAPQASIYLKTPRSQSSSSDRVRRDIKTCFAIIRAQANWVLKLQIQFPPAGTGTAPFRSFWQELDEIKSADASFVVPKVWLFFGCRRKCLDLYNQEKMEMQEKGVLDRVFLALSREINMPKVNYRAEVNKQTFRPLKKIFFQLSDARAEADNEGICGNLRLDSEATSTYLRLRWRSNGWGSLPNFNVSLEDIFRFGRSQQN